MKKVRYTFLAVLMFAFGSLSASAQKAEVPKGVAIDKAGSGHVAHLKPLSLTQLSLDEQARTSIPLHQMALEVLYRFSGEAPARPAGELKLLFRVTSSNYVFLHGQKVLLALDNENGKGRAIIVGDTNYNSKPPEFNSVYEETLEVSAPAEILSRIAKANSVEIYVGPVVYKVTKDQQKKLSTYFDYINP
jgi:hypothetical protein